MPGDTSAGAFSNAIDDPRLRRGATALAAVLFFYFVLQRFWPAPLGVIVQGLIIGGLTALIAFGLALVYRSNRIINFAQGDLGGVPASLGVLLILGPGIPYLLAFPIAIVAGIALGAFVEFVFIRRFFKAPRLILTVVTIGISQLLAGVATVLPRVFGRERSLEDFPTPFRFDFTIGHQVITGNEVVAMILVPVVILALAAFFRFTDIGMAVRASAENSDRAALLGVPVKRVQTIVWIVATTLATVAIFLRAGIVGLPIGSVLGPTILVRALAAAVIGRMERLPTILVASLALGVIEASVIFSAKTSLLVDPILFVVVLGALLFQRRGAAARADEGETTSWQSAREVRPIPRELRALPEVVWGVRALKVLFAAVLVALPMFLSNGRTNLAAVVVIFAMVGVSLVILTGWAGQVSLGQVGFVGIGAAVGGYLSATRGWDLSLALVGSGVAGALSAMVIGVPALRIRGLYLAVVTLAFSLAVSSYVLNANYIHWLPRGPIERTALFGRIHVNTETRYYYLCLAGLALVIAIARGIRTSRTGRALIGVRENTRAAQAFGVNATTTKLTAFAISGFIAAFAGGLFVHHQEALGISAYEVQDSRQAFIMVVIGGLGSVPGALMGTIFIQGVQYFTNVFPLGVRPYLDYLTTGFGLVLVLLLIPGGFSQVFYSLRDGALKRIAARRALIVPSLIADEKRDPVDVAAAELVAAEIAAVETDEKVPV